MNTELIRERGFSIVEVIISMVIFMLVTGTIFGLLNVARQNRTTIDNQVQMTKGNRIGLNLIGRDTYNAGYGYPVDAVVLLPDTRLSARLGTTADADNTRDTAPPIIAGNDLNINNLNPNPAARTDQVTFLFKDTTFNRVNNIIANPTAAEMVSQPMSADFVDEDSLTIPPASGTNAGFNLNDLLLVTGNNSAALVVVTGLNNTNELFFNNGDILNFNNAAVGGPLDTIAGTASIMRVRMVTYFVSADGTLTRREFANVPPPGAVGPFVDEPLVYGVEDLQISYILNDGTISVLPAVNRLQAIRQVRFTVTVRTTELNAPGQPVQPVRATQTTTFSTRNLGYDAN